MLLDTSGLFCLLDRTDSRYEEATTLYTQAPIRITNNYVLAELVPLCATRGIPQTKVLIFVRDLLNNPDIETIWIDEPLHLAALDLLDQRLDKTYSLCDAVSFLLMRGRGISDALTTDGHFSQEGFRKLLPS